MFISSKVMIIFYFVDRIKAAVDEDAIYQILQQRHDHSGSSKRKKFTKNFMLIANDMLDSELVVDLHNELNGANDIKAIDITIPAEISKKNCKIR